MSKRFIILILAILILIIGFFIIRGEEDTWICENNQWVKHGVPASEMPTEGCGEVDNEEGDSAELANPAAVNCLAKGGELNIREGEGGQGGICQFEDGSECEEWEFFRGNCEPGDSLKIIVSEPKVNSVITSPLHIAGQARGWWFFEATFPIQLLDSEGKVVAESYASTKEDWMTEEFVNFTADLDFEAVPGSGVLVLKRDNPSDLPANDDEIRVQVQFSESQEMMAVKVYFGNSEKDSGQDCQAVYELTREIPKTKAVARAALEQLLLGVNAVEKEQGYFTSLNEGININSLEIENGAAKVDFDKKIEEAVGGSCRVANIRSQIIKTLEQFETVQSVVISVEGRTEDILQP